MCPEFRKERVCFCWIASTVRLEDSEIDLSCKFDLFDVLDADLSGELEFEVRANLVRKKVTTTALLQVGSVPFLELVF